MKIPVTHCANDESIHATLLSVSHRDTGNGFFDDQSDFESCKSEVEDYVRNVKSFSQCLVDANDEAVRKSNEIIEKFNCRAAGKSYC